MNRFSNRLCVSLIVAVAFAFLTWVMIGGSAYRVPTGMGLEYLGEVIMVALLPGMFVGVVVSGNIHVADVWVVAIGNSVFYFAVAYVTSVVLAKRRARDHGIMPTNPTDGSSTTPKLSQDRR